MIKALVVKRKKKFLMKYANSASRLSIVCRTRIITVTNVKNFHGSLTTAVKAQNDTIK